MWVFECEPSKSIVASQAFVSGVWRGKKTTDKEMELFLHSVLSWIRQGHGCYAQEEGKSRKNGFSRNGKCLRDLRMTVADCDSNRESIRNKEGDTTKGFRAASNGSGARCHQVTYRNEKGTPVAMSTKSISIT